MDESLKELKSNDKKTVLNMASMEERMTRVEKAVFRLEKDFQVLFTKLNMLLGDTNMERFYQSYLEKKYGATHSKGMFGITDIETEDKIIEIKRWDNYKGALGQLLSYTSRLHSKGNAPKIIQKKPVVYFFGEKPKHVDDIISLFKQNNINIFHIYVKLDNEVVEEEIHHTLEYNPFYKWLVENIEECQNSELRLTDMVKRYDASQTLHSKQLKPFKITVQRYIFNNYPNIKSLHGKIRGSDKTFSGWKHLKIKE